MPTPAARPGTVRCVRVPELDAALLTRDAADASIASVAVAIERARCLDAVEAAWGDMIARARAEGRLDVTGSDLLNLCEGIRARIASPVVPVMREG